MEIKCSSCGHEEEVKLLKEQKYNYGDRIKDNIRCVWINAAGHKWRGSVCWACLLQQQRKAKGHGPRSESTDPRIKRSYDSEVRAARHFKSLGFSVAHGRGKGPDLFCKIGELVWTVEVKIVGRNSGTWRVSAVTPARRNDDLVAMVMPNGRVYIDSMANHIEHENCSGRSVGTLVKEFGL